MLNVQDGQEIGQKVQLDGRPGQEIQLDKITKAWGDTVALNNVSLTIPAGSFTALLGPSGCGKSTALRLISGLEEVTTGNIRIGNQDVTHNPPAARNIAMVFQSYALFPHLSVAENIIFGLRVRKVPRPQRDKKLKHVSEMLGLSLLLDRKPSQLSGGQQQRVALGRAIVADKSIFLMDEPLSNLDAKLRSEMREEIRDLQRRLGVTMVYVTHDQVEAVTMADQVVLMNQGTIEQVASPKMLYEKPATQFAAKFIGTPPMVTFSPHILTSSSKSASSGFEERLIMGIRPEALTLAETGQIKGGVSRVEYMGADTLVDCSIDSEILTCRLPGHTDVKVGETIQLKFKPQDLHAFDATTGIRIDELPEEFGSFLDDPIAARTSQKSRKKAKTASTT